MPFLKINTLLGFNWLFKLGLTKGMYIPSMFFLVLVCLEALAKIVQL